MKKDSEKSVQEPEQLHKRQNALQIMVPVVGGSAICLALCLMLVITTSSNPQSTEQWAQISTMFLILPAIFMGLVLLAIFILVGILAGKWNKSWPPALKNFRMIIIHFEQKIEGLAQKPAQPLIKIKSAYAGFRAIFKK